MTEIKTEASIFERISTGEFDGQLTQLFDAVKNRHRYIGRQKGLENAAAFKPGDPVEITGNISPKYLLGITGKVSPEPSRKPGFTRIDLDPGQDTGKFSSASLNVPAVCLTKTGGE